MTEKTRTITKEIEIEASPQAVWEALTHPEELVRWFPLQARVKPGVGGSMWYSWGPPWEGDSRIEIWEPNRRLKTVTIPSGTDVYTGRR